MSKIKLTKGELKQQRDGLKQFRRYLPTLQLKKQQLQMKILEARNLLNDRQTVLQDRIDEVEDWIGLLADPAVDVSRLLKKGFKKGRTKKTDAKTLQGKLDLSQWLIPNRIEKEMVNIAGANVPVFENIYFRAIDYDLYGTPFWVDAGIRRLRLIIKVIVEIKIIKEQIAILEKELRTTTQRVNLFEKIKIPESMENIRKINIYLGDQMANAVGVSKVAKKKVEAKNLEVMAA